MSADPRSQALSALTRFQVVGGPGQHPGEPRRGAPDPAHARRCARRHRRGGNRVGPRVRRGEYRPVDRRAAIDGGGHRPGRPRARHGAVRHGRRTVPHLVPEHGDDPPRRGGGRRGLPPLRRRGATVGRGWGAVGPGVLGPGARRHLEPLQPLPPLRRDRRLHRCGARLPGGHRGEPLTGVRCRPGRRNATPRTTPRSTSPPVSS